MGVRPCPSIFEGIKLAPDMQSATIVITTKDRREELRMAIFSALKQDAQVEVLVVDDGSTDGTAEMVCKEFPSVRFYRDETSRGYIVQRNRAARLATAPIIISIDDDATFSSPQTVRQVLAEFNDEHVGAVAIPYVNIRQDNVVRQEAPGNTGLYITASFVGTAYAVRKDVFNRIGGFREILFHQGEEDDFCLRMLAASLWTRLSTADAIHHFESPKRDLQRMDVYGRRNNVLFVWLNVPWPWFPIHMAGTCLKGIWFGCRVGRPLRMIRGLLAGYGTILQGKAHRQTISGECYRNWRDLRRNGPYLV